MNSQPDLAQLLMVSTAKYDHQRQVFSKIVAQESHLRQEIARLNALDQGVTEEEATISGMRIIGADLLWQGWLSRSKSELNMQLARVLAVKTHEQDKVRQAFGKMTALQELTKSEQQRRQKTKAQSSLDLAIERALR